MTADAVGGVWVYATSLASALCHRGYEVTLVTMGPAPREDQLRPLRGLPGLHVEVTDLALEWMDPEGADVRRARGALLRIADGAEPDVVHLNSYREAVFDWPAPVLVAAHSCVLSWWHACRVDAPLDVRWRPYTAAVARGLRKADLWVAPSVAFRDVVESIYRPLSCGRVIWNGTALQTAASSKQPFILAAGRLWDEAKNLSLLTSVAAESDWPLRVAGPLAISADAAIGPTTANATYLGMLPHGALLDEMRRAAVFASPARYEPFGLTVLEAAACGCALALADIASFGELWSGAAVFFDPCDPQALLAALRRLCRDGALRRRLQRAAAARARHYSLATMTARYCGLYETMSTGSSAGVTLAPAPRAELRA
jgi:glycosyltransferase involved in cell wall biosynthesis